MRVSAAAASQTLVIERPANIAAPDAERIRKSGPNRAALGGPASEDSAGSRITRFDRDGAGAFRRHGPVSRVLLVRRISGREHDWHLAVRVRKSARQKIRHVSRSTYKRSGAWGDRFVAAWQAAPIADKPRNNADPSSSLRDPLG